MIPASEYLYGLKFFSFFNDSFIFKVVFRFVFYLDCCRPNWLYNSHWMYIMHYI